MAKLVIRVDGSSEIGLGHFVRCIALGQIALQSFEVVFVSIALPDVCLADLQKNGFSFVKIQNEMQFYQYLSSMDVVVLDGYHFTEQTEKNIKDIGCKLVTIDDLFNRHFIADCIINHGMGIQEANYSKAPYTKIYHGTDYLLVRSNFYDAALKKRRINACKNLYINMGGSDPFNITTHIVDRLDTTIFETIQVVLGAASQNLLNLSKLIDHKNLKNVVVHYNLDQNMMQEVMEKCDLAICTPSGVAYELCCVGIGMVVCKTADNQKHFFREFVDRGLAIGVDSSDENYVELIIQACSRLISNIALVNNQFASQKIFFNAAARNNIFRILRD